MYIKQYVVHDNMITVKNVWSGFEFLITNIFMSCYLSTSSQYIHTKCVSVLSIQFGKYN